MASCQYKFGNGYLCGSPTKGDYCTAHEIQQALTPQEQAFNAWWNGLPQDERALYQKTQARMVWNAAWKAKPN